MDSGSACCRGARRLSRGAPLRLLGRHRPPRRSRPAEPRPCAHSPRVLAAARNSARRSSPAPCLDGNFRARLVRISCRFRKRLGGSERTAGENRMPGGLDSADRKLLIGAGIVLVGLILVSALLSPSRTSGGASFPSSYSNAWDGAKAAFLLLQESGYDVQRWELSPSDLDENSSQEVLIFAEPLLPPTSDEKARILSFLQHGGRVVATGFSAASLLPEAEHFAPSNEYEERVKFPALLPSPLIQDAPEITMVPPKDWKPAKASHLVVYGNKDTAAVITYRVGAGQVIWWGSDTPLINGGISDPANLALFLNCVAPSRDKRILWDEYFHGARGSLWAYFAKTPLPWGIVQVGLAFLAILATYSRRSGPIRMPAKV